MQTLWSNQILQPAAATRLERELARRDYRLVQAADSDVSGLHAGRPDPALAAASVAYGQPNAADVLAQPGVRWVALSSAGYTRYDRDDFRAALRARGTAFTNASSVFADPCAQQMLAGMLALARTLPSQLRNQDGPRVWRYAEDRFRCSVLTGQTVLLLGFGAIGRRLATLLAPFGGKIMAYRRAAQGDEGVAIVTEAGLDAALAEADHVVNVLPDAPATRGFMSAARFARMKPGARFYNVGRGTTVDQAALIAALQAGQLSGAYLDVMEPEPLPPEHPLWDAPNCFITCHVGGGTVDQDEKLVDHLLGNLDRWTQGAPLIDRVI